MDQIYLAVIGVGGVGKAFLSQLSDSLSDQTRPVLVFLSRSSKNVFSPDYQSMDVSQGLEFLETSSSPRLSLPDLAQYLAAAPGPAVVVDNTSSQEVADAYPSFLRKGVSVVTPNKKAFSSGYALWQSIFCAASKSKAMVYHESSVGAGLPVISTLKDLMATGDQVTRIEGVFSGTMSYLFNTFSSADSETKDGWSQIVARAKEAGFTEPDPRDDLNGMDVARKLTILARLAGQKVEGPNSFPVQSLIPQELESVSSADEFMSRLPKHDMDMDKYNAEAKQANKVLRYVGSVDLGSGAVQVGVKMVELGSPLGSLRGSDNLICFYTKRYGTNALVIQGAGAGGDVTAMGVTADLIKVVERLRGKKPKHEE